MRKIIISLLIIFFAFGFTGVALSASADDATNVALQTDIILPSTYLEFYKLSSPVDVWTDEVEYVIAEEKRIVYYNGQSFFQFDLGGYSVSEVQKKGNFILFLSASRLFTIDLTTGNIDNTGIVAGTSFDLYNNTIVTNPSNTIEFYLISNSVSAFEFDPLASRDIALGYTPNALCLISDNVLYYMHEGKLIQLIQNTQVSVKVLTENIDNARSVTNGGGHIYVSASDGIYKLADNGQIVNFINATGVNSLSQLCNPRGIYYTNGKLYICDATNALTCYDAINAKFTDFYITANHTADNRISENSNAITSSNGFIYVLDENSIKVIDEKTKNLRAIPIKNYFGVKLIAVTANTIMLSSGQGVHLVKEDNGGLSEITISSDLSHLKNVTALTVFENDYYILNNETVENRLTAVIYRFSTQTNKLEYHSSLIGRGDGITSDVFGDIYLTIYNEVQSTYSVIATDISASKQIVKLTGNDKILDIYADYEGNLFSLVDGNQIIKSNTASSNRSTLTISPNLPSTKTAKSFTHIQGSQEVYFLFGGFILTTDSDKLGISTPKQIKVPDGFSIAFDVHPQFITLKSGAKLFEVNLDNSPAFDEYFDYKQMSANNDSEIKYVLITTTERYSLIANEKRRAIVRTEDTVPSSLTITPELSETYAINDCNLYAYPTISEFAKIASVQKNQPLTILNRFEFGGIEFVLVKSNSFEGYVARSMLKEGIASDFNYSKYTSYTLINNTSAYYDEGLRTEYKSLSKGDVVNVLEIKEGVATIYVDGKIVYISQSAIKPKSPVVIRNILLLIILAISLSCTAVYFLQKIYKKKD